VKGQRHRVIPAEAIKFTYKYRIYIPNVLPMKLENILIATSMTKFEINHFNYPQSWKTIRGLCEF
jgi:hypothetical protein